MRFFEIKIKLTKLSLGTNILELESVPITNEEDEKTKCWGSSSGKDSNVGTKDVIPVF